MPKDFRYKREEDFLAHARGVDPKFVTVEDSVVRAFFRGGWMWCVYKAEAKDAKEAAAIEEKYVREGFTPISIEESPIRIF